MNLPEIWDTDLFPLAPVTRPRDIPADHSVDVWVSLNSFPFTPRATTTGRTTRSPAPRTTPARTRTRPRSPSRTSPASWVRIPASFKTSIPASSNAPPSCSSPSSSPRSPHPSPPAIPSAPVCSRNSGPWWTWAFPRPRMRRMTCSAWSFSRGRWIR